MDNLRYNLYDYFIEDVALEVSNDSFWRRKLFQSNYEVEYMLTFQEPHLIPEYIRKDICENKLEFCIMKVQSCPEDFDPGLIIFKFWSREYPNILRYSGNNENVF